jgi:hypothetical protein
MAIELTPITSSTAVAQDGYLSVAEADALAGQLVARQVASYVGTADADQRQAALNQASADIDAGQWQGQRYDSAQARAFPRLQSAALTAPSTAVWDLDEFGVAIVPERVYRAVLLQADSILAGRRNDRMDARHDGVSSQSADGLSEAYSGPAEVLCRAAAEVMRVYRLRTGQLL